LNLSPGFTTPVFPNGGATVHLYFSRRSLPLPCFGSKAAWECDLGPFRCRRLLSRFNLSIFILAAPLEGVVYTQCQHASLPKETIADRKAKAEEPSLFKDLHNILPSLMLEEEARCVFPKNPSIA